METVKLANEELDTSYLFSRGDCIGDALLQNNIQYCISENQFRMHAKRHDKTTNDYFYIRNKFNMKHSSVAFVLTRDNFVVVGKRSQTFAWTSFSNTISKSFDKYMNKTISFTTLQKIIKNEINNKYWLFANAERNLLVSKCLRDEEPRLYKCLTMFPNTIRYALKEGLNDNPKDLILLDGHPNKDNPKDLILLGGHPNKNETMQNTLLREISEEGNITSCVKLCPLGTLLIYDHRFRKFFYCNLFLFYTPFTKKEVQNKFKPNKEIESILFTLLREPEVHPLEIVQNCLT